MFLSTLDIGLISCNEIADVLARFGQKVVNPEIVLGISDSLIKKYVRLWEE